MQYTCKMACLYVKEVEVGVEGRPHGEPKIMCKTEWWGSSLETMVFGYPQICLLDSCICYYISYFENTWIFHSFTHLTLKH